jgi:CO/xanthine dehydrogenase Mo-binding subunit
MQDRVGVSTDLIDAAEKAAGRFSYVTDMELSRMLFGKIKRSPFPHARILHIDISRALALPGVKAVITAGDCPNIPFGPIKTIPDWEILASKEVRFVGDEVAAVAAVNPETAEEAVSLIDVEYEELPDIVDFVKALEQGAPRARMENDDNVAYKFFIERGNVQEGFKASDYVFQNVFRTQPQYHAFMETTAGIAAPDSQGRLSMWLPIQGPFFPRMNYAKALGIPFSKLHIVQIPAGGAFGGKWESNLHLICAILALKTCRPVKIVNTREEDIEATNPRVPMQIDMKLGMKKDGTIMAKEVKVIADNGARTIYGPGVLSTACYRIDSLYKMENVRNEGVGVYTNTVPKSAFRGFGNEVALLGIETLLNQASRELDIDPGELRKRNAFKDGETSVHGWYISTCGLTKCIDAVYEASKWTGRKSKDKCRGMGFACANHVSGNSSFFTQFHGSSAIVQVGIDGCVMIFCGEADTGQGIRTLMAQIAAQELEIPIDNVMLAPVDSDFTPYNLGTWATRGTVNAGHAVKAAAEDARNQLISEAARLLGVSAEDIKYANGSFSAKGKEEESISFSEVSEQAVYRRAGAPILGQGFYVPDTIAPDPVTKYGNISPVYPFGAHLAEVEVDPDTGRVKVLNYYAAHDIGKAINPIQVHGQIDGAVGQGIGWALLEDMVMIKGKVQNPNFLDYRIPTFLDVPDVKSYLVEPNDPLGPYGAKGIGEPSFDPVAAAIADAIYDAIGIRFYELPITPERIVKALKGKK